MLQRIRWVGIAVWLGLSIGLSVAQTSPDSAMHSEGEAALVGVPYVRFHSPNDYNADPQNYGAAQDNLGRLCVANKRGVLVYDGTQWELLELPLSQPVYSVATRDDGRIYVGSSRELGYFEQNVMGQMVYHSLVAATGEDPRLFGRLDRVLVTTHNTFFLGEKFILQFDKDNRFVKYYRSEAGYGFAFIVRDQLYVKEYTIGIKTLISNELKFLPGGDEFAEVPVIQMLAWGQTGLLICTEDRGLRILDNGSSTAFPTSIDAELRSSRITDVQRLANNQFVISTLVGTLHILDVHGHSVVRMDNQKGLGVSAITALFPDRDGHIWLTTEFGIFWVNYPAQVTYYDSRFGIEGTFDVFLRSGNLIYVGTSQGLYYRNVNDPQGNFIRVPNIREVYSMVSADGYVFVADASNLWAVQGGAAAEMADVSVESMLISRRNSRVLALGRAKGLDFFRITEGDFSPLSHYDSLDFDITGLMEDNSGNLWIQTPMNGVISTQIQSGVNNLEFKRYGTENGLPALTDNYLFLFNNQVLVGTVSGLLQYDPVSDAFIPFEEFGEDIATGRARVIHLTEASATEAFLGVQELDALSGDRRNVVYRVQKNGGIFKLVPIPTPNLRGIHTIFSPEPNQVWMGNLNELVVADFRQPQPIPAPFTAHFRRIVAGVDSVVRFLTVDNTLLGTEMVPQFPYSLNTLTFTFAAPTFSSNNSGLYFQYMLEGVDETPTWSRAGLITKKEFTNLQEGDYVFRVRAINANGEYSKEAVFAFRILPPWYRTWYAYLGFGVGLVFLIYASASTVSRIQRRKVLNENARLERLVAERTTELESTNQQLGTTNQKLEAQTHELAKQKQSLEEANTSLLDATIKLQQQQTQLVSSEKMAVLGKLTPSVAHEINTPLGAIIGSYENLQSALPQLLLELSNALRIMPESQMVAFWSVVENLRANSQVLGSREEKQRIAQLEDELTALGIPSADEAARVFVKIGLPTIPADVYAPLMEPTASEFLRYINQVGMLWKQLINIKLSSERARIVVQALRSYTRVRSDSEQMVPTKVDENIDLVLTVYNYYIVKNLELVRDYQEVPVIQALPEQLMQVWTNLLTNAADAVHQLEGFRGRLTIRIRQDQGDVLVEFENNGPAIPESVLPHIFDWQYSTKGEGGTGLGLAITHDIVASHKGHIYVDSTHERTIFSVRLPIGVSTN